jgi:hypothetical protein
MLLPLGLHPGLEAPAVAGVRAQRRYQRRRGNHQEQPLHDLSILGFTPPVHIIVGPGRIIRIVPAHRNHSDLRQDERDPLFCNNLFPPAGRQ